MCDNPLYGGSGLSAGGRLAPHCGGHAAVSREGCGLWSLTVLSLVPAAPLPGHMILDQRFGFIVWKHLTLFSLSVIEFL